MPGSDQFGFFLRLSKLVSLEYAPLRNCGVDKNSLHHPSYIRHLPLQELHHLSLLLCSEKIRVEGKVLVRAHYSILLTQSTELLLIPVFGPKLRHY